MNLTDVQAMPTGTVLTYTPEDGVAQEWTKDGDNLTRNGLVVSAESFTAPLAEDRITVGPGASTRTAYIAALPEVDLHTPLNGQTRCHAIVEPLSAMPDHVLLVWEDPSHGWLVGRGEVRSYAVPEILIGARGWWVPRVDVTVVTTTPTTEEAIARINAYAEENDDTLANLLVELGLRTAVRRETVTVGLGVSGTSTVTLGSALLSELVGGAVDCDGFEVDVEWSRRTSIDFEVDEGTCACDEVNRTTVNAELDRLQVAPRDDLNWGEATCPNCLG